MSMPLKMSLTLVNILTFVGIFYFFLPGYPHLLQEGTDSQPGPGFLCLALFLFAFVTAVQMSPPRIEEEEQASGTCWACGRQGRGLYWWTVDAPGSNQRVAYLIHRPCAWLAEKQVGL